MTTAQSTAGELPHIQGTVTLSVQANGGSVTVEVLHDDGTDTWVVADTITEDGAWPLSMDRGKVRITPSGGATWAVR